MTFKIAALVGTIGLVAAASYHASFKSAIPAPGSTVPSPAKISVTFSEEILAPPLSTFSLLKADSTPAGPLKVTLKAGDKATLEAVVAKPLAPGKYIVKWKNGAADDGHALRGAFAFTVAAPK